MLPISRCRHILNYSASEMSDAEIEELRDMFVVLSDLAIDSYLEKRNKVNGDVYEKSKTGEVL